MDAKNVNWEHEWRIWNKCQLQKLWFSEIIFYIIWSLQVLRLIYFASRVTQEDWDPDFLSLTFSKKLVEFHSMYILLFLFKKILRKTNWSSSYKHHESHIYKVHCWDKKDSRIKHFFMLLSQYSRCM